MKTDKNFRLSKTTKKLLAGMRGESRNQFKKMMIDAELSASRPAPSNKEKRPNNNSK